MCMLRLLIGYGVKFTAKRRSAWRPSWYVMATASAPLPRSSCGISEGPESARTNLPACCATKAARKKGDEEPRVEDSSLAG